MSGEQEQEYTGDDIELEDPGDGNDDNLPQVPKQEETQDLPFEVPLTAIKMMPEHLVDFQVLFNLDHF